MLGVHTATVPALAERINLSLQAPISWESVLQAESMDAAHALLADHPHLGTPGCGIEVYGTMSLPWQ